MKFNFLAWLTKTGSAFSQILNTMLLQGDPNESISGRSYRLRDNKYWGISYKLVNMLFFLQEDHCKEAYDKDLVWSERYVENHYSK
jgi:hypothetical protein